MSETGINKRILLAAQKVKAVLFRNNVGMGWVGKSSQLAKGSLLMVKKGNKLLPYHTKGYERIIFDPRPLHAGLFEGSSDNIGWLKVTVTPEMVGSKIAVFMGAESKVPVSGKLSPEQEHWISVVNSEGGVAFVATSPEDFEEQVNNYKKSIGN